MKQDARICQLLDKLAAESDGKLNREDIHDIVSFQFETLKYAIENKQFVELPRIGKFMVKEGRDKHLSPEKRFYEPHMGRKDKELNHNDTEGTE